MLIFASLPSYLIRFEILGTPFTLLEAMILVSFFVWFIWQTEFKNFIRGKYGWREFQENRNKRTAYPFGLEIVLLLIISFIAVAVAGFSDSALGIWKAYFFEPALLFILILNVFAGGKGLSKILWPLAISALAVSALAIYQKFTGAWIFNEFWATAGQRRVVSFFGYPNAVGLYLGPLILVMLGWLSNKISDYKKSSQKILNFEFRISNKLLIFNFQFLKQFFIGLTIVVSVLVVYFAKSKGAILGVAAGLAIFAFLAGGKKMKWAIISLVLIFIIGVSAYAPLRDYALDKTIYSKSYQIRRVGWQETKKMLFDGRIISGAGLANYKTAVAPYHQEGVFIEDYRDPEWLNRIRASAEFRQKNWQPLEVYLYPHNIFLNFWSELGLAGVLLFAWVIVKYFYIGIKNLKFKIKNSGEKKNKYLIIGLIGAMVVIIAHGLVDVPYFKNDLAVMFWALVAMMSLINLENKKAIKQ